MRLPTASGLDRAILCPASVTLPQAPMTGAAAGAGQAIHAYLADPRHDLLAVPEEHRAACDAIDLAELPAGVEWAHEVSLAWDPQTDVGRELGRCLGRDYSAARPGEFVGTADVVGLTGSAAHVYDFKTGWGRVPGPRENWQLRFLALAATRAYGRDCARVGLISLAGDVPRWRVAGLDAMDLDLAAAELRGAPSRWVPGAEVHQGDHCAYCPAWDSCPAKLALFRQAVDMPTAITAENAAAVYARAEAVAQVLGRVRAGLEMYARERPIPLGGGRVFGPVATTRESVDGEKACDVIVRLHGPAAARIAVELKASKASIERAIGSIAARGQRAALVAAALAQIEAAGGIERKTTETVREHQERE